MNRFPQMLYCFPAAGMDVVSLQDGSYGTKIVADDTELEAALADSWFEASPDARAAHATKVAEAAAAAAAETQAADVTPPTREELEAKATELGIRFDGRTSDKKLRDLIAATLEA